MGDLTRWTHEQGSRDGAERAGTPGLRLHRAALLALLAVALISTVAAGCTQGQSRVIEVTPRTFKSLVIDSKQPVLINFYKDG
jgi:hypothetical protein